MAKKYKYNKKDNGKNDMPGNNIPSEKILAKLKGKQYKSSSELCEIISDKTNGIAVLSFSTGKDSIGSWLQMKRYFKKIIPIYLYGVPNLKFIEKSLIYYEDYFKTKIIRLPSPSLVKQLNSGLFQTINTQKIIDEMRMPNFTRDDLFEEIKRKYKIEGSYSAIGIRATDNLQRWTSFVTNGAVNEKRQTFWPIFDWSLRYLETELRRSNVKLPIDYKLWGKTYDSLQYRFTVKIRDNFPEDFDTIKTYFPLIELEMLRYEKI